MKPGIITSKTLSVLCVVISSLVLSVISSFAGELDQLVDEALLNNPSLAAAKARWEQATYKPAQVGSLKDPILSFSFSNYPSDTLSSADTPMTGNELKLAQAFPFPGKLGERSAQAEEQAHWFEAVYRDQHYQIARKVKDVWFRLYLNQKAIEVTERNLALIDDVIRLTEVRYETGEGLQQDVLKAQIQRSTFMERMTTLEQQKTALQSELDRLLARKSGSSYIPPGELELPEVAYTLGDFLAASQQRPMNSAYKSLLRQFQHQKRLAELDDYPDVTLWGSWRFRDNDLPDKGTDFVSAGVSFNLPVYREKRRAALAEADAALSMAQRQSEDFNNSVSESINKAFARMEEMRDQAQLYKQGIIPQTSQSFQASLGSYQVGKVAFISLLDALMMTYKSEMEYYRVASEYMRSLAWLEAESTVALLGAPVDTDKGRDDNRTEAAQ